MPGRALAGSPNFQGEAVMTRDETVSEIKSWSAADRLALLDELWTSLDQDDLAPALTPEVHSLLDERIAGSLGRSPVVRRGVGRGPCFGRFEEGFE